MADKNPSRAGRKQLVVVLDPGIADRFKGKARRNGMTQQGALERLILNYLGGDTDDEDRRDRADAGRGELPQAAGDGRGDDPWSPGVGTAVLDAGDATGVDPWS